MGSRQVIQMSSLVRAAKDQVATRLGQEMVLLGLKDGTYYGLDEVGATIWDLLKDPIAVGAIRDALVQQYEVDEQTCQRDVIALLNDLFGHGLIEIMDETPA
jgi:hypothetical protein